eukprot:TRINITY_DN102791_c0_g1_i2.p1 TRINITY_DN102791_c0_g1~~TRINITY_DN102791_c0_g1_i2.p1  ORF type:complete len:640 (+),score=118.73 TRINITY_DN102791_c0_g1_i2:142-2061(+)
MKSQRNRAVRFRGSLCLLRALSICLSIWFAMKGRSQLQSVFATSRNYFAKPTMAPGLGARLLKVAPLQATMELCAVSKEEVQRKDQQHAHGCIIEALQMLTGTVSGKDSASKRDWETLAFSLSDLAKQGRSEAEVILVSALRLPNPDVTSRASLVLRSVWGNQPSAQVSVELRQAMQLQQLKKNTEAITIYTKLIGEHPTWVGAYQQRAKCYAQTGEYLKAVDDLRKALQLSPVNYQIMMELGLVLSRAGFHQQAIASLEQANNIFPTMPMIHVFMRDVRSGMPDADGSTPQENEKDGCLTDVTELMPTPWATARNCTVDETCAFLEWGMLLMRHLMSETQDDKAETCKALASLKRAWEAEHEGSNVRGNVVKFVRFLEILLESYQESDVLMHKAEEEEKHWTATKELFKKSAASFTGIDAQALALKLADQGYLHIPQVGVDSAILDVVQEELPRLEHTVSGGDSSTYDIVSRFFPSDLDKVGRDIPGLHELDSVLNNLIQRIVDHLPNKMTLRMQEDAMVAAYRPGAFYYRHTDNKIGKDRCLTAVYYLNRNWDSRMGGSIRLFPGLPDNPYTQSAELEGVHHVDVLPQEDSLILFDSHLMLHEVLRHTAEGRQRYAMTLWFCGSPLKTTKPVWGADR